MDTKPISTENFSLSEGGLFNNMLAKLQLDKKPGIIAVLALGIAGLPLIIITAIEGTLYSGTQMPFLQDYAMQGRVLIALPLLVLIKVAIDNKVMAVIKYISEALVSEEERQTVLKKLLRWARRFTSSGIMEIILLLVVIVSTILLVKGGVYSALESGTTSWMTAGAGENMKLSLAGYWSVLISIPMFQFLLLRWLWRYFIWTVLLYRLSKANLNLLPTHADRSGGLGIIILAQKSFNLIFVAGSIVISGQFIAQLIAHPDAFNSIRGLAIAYIVISIVLLILPLLFFLGKLTRTKNDGLLHLSSLGATLSGKFEREWVNDLPIEKRMEEQQVDPSLLFDYSGLYDQLQQLRAVPVTLRDIIGMAVVLFVPFIPILFIHFSVAELLQRIAGMLA